MSYRYHDYCDANRRTRQRWSAHAQKRCNTKCRFCRKAGMNSLNQGFAKLNHGFNDLNHAFHDALGPISQLATDLSRNRMRMKMTDIPSDPSQAKSRLKPTADGVLAETVANEYHPAAKKVARTKAEVEINQAAFIPGMMVYHRFNHHPCILLAETDPGIWRIELKDGNVEEEVPSAILTPICPNIFVRMWKAVCRVADFIFRKDVQRKVNSTYLVTERRFRWTGFMGVVMTFLVITSITIACRLIQ